MLLLPLPLLLLLPTALLLLLVGAAGLHLHPPLLLYRLAALLLPAGR